MICSLFHAIQHYIHLTNQDAAFVLGAEFEEAEGGGECQEVEGDEQGGEGGDEEGG